MDCVVISNDVSVAPVRANPEPGQQTEQVCFGLVQV